MPADQKKLDLIKQFEDAEWKLLAAEDEKFVNIRAVRRKNPRQRTEDIV